MNDYEAEVQERWGDTDAFRQSQARTSKYSHADFAAAKVDQEAVTERFATAFGNGVDCSSSEMQRNLALMYIGDERFKKDYDGRVRGLAQYVHDAIMAKS